MMNPSLEKNLRLRSVILILPVLALATAHTENERTYYSDQR
jgi:hypothetical protein